MSYLGSVERFARELGIDIYSVPKTSFMFVVLVGKDRANPRSSPTEYRDGEGDLDFIARMGELNIIIGPEGFVELNPFMLPKIMLRFFHFHNKRLLNQRVPGPLVKLLSLKSFQLTLRDRYLVQFLSVLFGVRVASDSSKPSEEPLLKRIHRIGSWSTLIVDKTLANRDFVANEIL